MSQPIATSTIVAQAFRLMEMSPVSSFGDDSEEAAAAAEQYPVVLDILLEGNDWGFASTLAHLPHVAILPDDVAADAELPWLYRLPGDCVKIREMVDKSVRWRIDEGYLRADQPGPLTIRYTRRIVNEPAAPATFRTAVAYQLAALLSPRWPGKASLADRLEQGAEKYRGKALADDRYGASAVRYDGGPDQPDWVAEARS